MEHSEFCITWATRLVYSYSKLSPKLKEYWTHLLNIEFSNKISSERIIFLESKASVKKKDAVALMMDEKPDDDQLVELFSLIQLLHHKAKIDHEVVPVKGLKRLIQEISVIIQKNNLKEAIGAISEGLNKKLTSYQSRVVIKVPIYVMPLILDHLLRWIILWNYGPESPWFWVWNIIGVTTIILVGSAVIWKINQKKNKQILDEYGGIKSFNLKKKITSSQYSLMALLVMVSILVIYILDTEIGLITAPITLLGFLIYYSLFINLFSMGRLDEQNLLNQLDQQPRFHEGLSADENDEAIVTLQTKLQSITSRLEAYILESVLFGALAFSGFLQIMAEGLVSFNDLQVFAENSLSIMSNVINFQFGKIPNTIAILTSPSGLFSMISVETLICSILFLSVIAARLRFSDIADKADRFLKLANSHKEKVVALYENGVINEQSQERFETLNNKVKDELVNAHQELENMLPVTSYMRFFRNAGISTFMIILISSSLFISGLLSFLFAILGISTIIYFNRSRLSEIGIHFNRNFRILFVRKGYYFLILGLLIFLLGIFTRVNLKWDQSDGLVSIGLILIGLFFFSIIAVMPLMDQKFEEATGGKVFFSPKAWNVIRIVWGGAVFLFIIGMLLRLIQGPGAGIALGISSSVLAILFLILGFQFSVKKWLGILLSVGIASQILGIMFKILHLPGPPSLLGFGMAVFTSLYIILGFQISVENRYWIPGLIGLLVLDTSTLFKINSWEGAGILFYLGLLMIPIIIISFIKLRNNFSQYFHGILIISAIVINVMGIFFIWNTYRKFELGYHHYTMDFNKIDEMTNVMNDVGIFEIGNADKLIENKNIVSEHIDRFYSFRQDVEPWVKYNRIHWRVVRVYYNTACHLFENGTSPAQLEIGLQITRAANDVGKNINFQDEDFYDSSCNPKSSFLPLLEAEFLLKLDRKEEAEKVLAQLIDVAPSDLKEELQQRLTAIVSN